MLKEIISMFLLILLGLTNLFGQASNVNQKLNRNGDLVREIKTIGDARVIIDYYENGIQKSICTYIDGKIQGMYKSFYNNGNIKSEISFNKGFKHGIARFYYSNGVISSYIEYENDLCHGRYILYDREGVASSVLQYVNGIKNERKDSILE